MKFIQTNTKKRLRQLLINWIIVPGVGGTLIALVFGFGELMDGKYAEVALDGTISMVFWAVLSNGNGFMLDVLESRWTWLDAPVKRLFSSIAFLLVYSVVASLVVVYGYVEWFFGNDFFKVVAHQGLFSILVVPLGITFGVSIIMHGRAFLIEWRREAINVEKLKNENLSAKLESLKSQINPHFLFNSLNALTSLVHADQNKAVDFIHKLADVYRYVLDHQYDELVSLSTEMELVKSFVFLNRIRFGQNLIVEYEGFDGGEVGFQIPPLTIQMLLENAFKHNEVSKEHHLQLTISRENDRLWVKNNINPLSSPKDDSNQLGLKNIVSRYEYLTSEKVEIRNDRTAFSVQVPLLKTATA